MADFCIKILECHVLDKGIMRIDRIGAGVGVILFNSSLKKAVGLHILAPYSASEQPKNPVMYANTAIPHALTELKKKGGVPPYSVAIAGGGTLLGTGDGTGTGQKVIEAVKAALEKAGLTIKLDQTGGSLLRSMVLDIDGGKISIT
jgi:chemotaxis receptor (MCP) glutamine deamidase CheD